MNLRERARNAFYRAVPKAELASYERAKLGRLNADGTATLTVAGRSDFVWVTKADSTVTIALNRGAVPLSYGLPVRMRLEQGVYVIHGRDRLREAPGTGSDNAYAVNPHDLDTHTDVTLTTPADNEFLRYDGTAWVNEAVDSDDIAEGAANLYMTAAERTKLTGIEAAADVTDAGNIASATNGATEKTTIVDDDELGGIDTEASNVLTWWKWSTIKATLKTYFDTLYQAVNTAVLLTGAQTVEGNKTFTGATIVARVRSFSTESVADDTAYSFAPAASRGVLLFNSLTGGGVRPNVQGLFSYRVSSGFLPIAAIIAQPSDAVETTGSVNTVLTGTTGTDGKVTIACHDANGLVYIENRTGGNIAINITIFG